MTVVNKCLMGSFVVVSVLGALAATAFADPPSAPGDRCAPQTNRN